MNMQEWSTGVCGCVCVSEREVLYVKVLVTMNVRRMS